MIEFLGNVKGQPFKAGEPIPATVVSEMFGVPIPSETRPGFIKVATGRAYTDHLGQKRRPQGTQVPAQFTVTSPSGTFTFRYYENVVANENGIGATYQPRKMSLSGEMEAFLPERAEQYLFWALNPLNASSPFALKDGQPLFESYDPEAEANARNAVEMFKAELLVKIATADARELRVKASGINVKGQTVAIDKTVSDSQIRSVLIRMAQEHPDEFLAQWDSPDVQFYGLVNTCIAQGVIEYRPAAHQKGQYAYFWGGTNEKIVEVGRNDTPLDVLRAAIAQQYAPYSTRMVEALGGRDALPGFAPPVIDARKLKDLQPKDMTAEQIVGAVVARDIVGFDRVRKEVKWVSVDGSAFEGNPILEAKVPKNWQDELAVFIDSTDGATYKSKLIKRLNNAFKIED